MKTYLILSIISSLIILSIACPTCPTPKSPPPSPPPKPTLCPPPPTPKPKPMPTPKPKPMPTPKPKPAPCPPPSTPPPPHCPIDILKLTACVDVLGGLVHKVVGQSATSSCCPFLSGVADADAALCLCTTIKAKALDVKLLLPVALQVLVNNCGKHLPSDYQCPA